MVVILWQKLLTKALVSTLIRKITQLSVKSTEFSGLILSRTGVILINLYDASKSNPEPYPSDTSRLKLSLSILHC